jgi:LEA14-like dessication related protein
MFMAKTNTRGSLDVKYLEMMPNLKEYIQKHLESVEQYSIRIKEVD